MKKLSVQKIVWQFFNGAFQDSFLENNDRNKDRGLLTLARGSAFTMHVKTSRSPGPEKTALWADDTSGGSENKYVLQLMTICMYSAINEFLS